MVGNVISAKPAGDGAIPLMALEAEMKVVSKAGERWVPMEEMYRGIGLSSIDASSEVATEVRFKKAGRKGTNTVLPNGQAKSACPSDVEWSSCRSC